MRLNQDEAGSQAEQLLPDKDAFIVVYCASTTCRNSRWLAQALAGMGYRNVAECEQGKADWIAAGLPVESDLAAA